MLSGHQAKTASEGFVVEAVSWFVPALCSELIFESSVRRRHLSSLIARIDSLDFFISPVERKYSALTVSHLIATSISSDVESLSFDAMTTCERDSKLRSI